MYKNQEISQELNELGVHLPPASMPDMDLPKAYFNSFSDNLLAIVKQEDFIQSLPKETPFQTPSHYFQSLDASLLETLHQEDFLSTLPKSMPYAVPADYFSQVSNDILNKIPANRPLKPFTFSRGIVARLSLAATLLLFMGIAFRGLNSTDTSSVLNATEHQLTSVSDEDIHQYISDHQTEIESSLALETIDDSKVDLQKLETEVLDNTLSHISDEELTNYLF